MCQPLGWHYFVKMTGYLPFTFKVGGEKIEN